jgi:exopolyphosphatase / guanosine-5'-triphosphate,3'-diphosphate pyrophosphatase
MKIERFAGIDIGSNAIRLLIVNVYTTDKEVHFKKGILVRVPIRLGEDSFGSNKISEITIDRMTDAMHSFRYLMKSYNVVNYKACATSALREAKNGHEVVKILKEKTKISIEIIDGKEEANILYHTQIKKIVDGGKAYLFIDVGGGSTELTYYFDNKEVASRSFKVGSVRMLKELVNKNDIDEMKAWCIKYIPSNKSINVIGTGGNINTVFKKSKKQSGESITLDYIQTLIKEMGALSYDERLIEYDLNPDRGDVVIPALEIYSKIMKWTNNKEIFVPKIGLADGLVHIAYMETIRKNKA